MTYQNMELLILEMPMEIGRISDFKVGKMFCINITSNQSNNLHIQKVRMQVTLQWLLILWICYTKDLGAIALVTSDSDFTPVVSRILSNGITVYGYGEDKTPESFVNACSQFIYVEKLFDYTKEDVACPSSNNNKLTKVQLRKDTKLVALLRKAAEQTSDDSGWSNIAAVGLYINQNSSFSPINYGYKKLGELIKATELFDVKILGENKTVMLIRDNRN